MLHSHCQVCGNPMHSQSYFGTEADGALNPDYCSNCYKSGQFYNRQGAYGAMPLSWPMFTGGSAGMSRWF